jgi:hypothetical protein
MSTRAAVEFCDVWEDESLPHPGALLYHHSDGYPEAMLPCIQKMLNHVANLVTDGPCLWWDSQRVAAMFVAWSVGEYQEPDIDPNHNTNLYNDNGVNGSGWGVPRFQPILKVPPDVEYLYRITFYRPGEARVSVYKYSRTALLIGSFSYPIDEVWEIPA